MRFDELELDAVPLVDSVAPLEPSFPDAAPRVKRLLALLADLSLFVALTLALSPLLPPARSWMTTAALASFVLVISYYYFVGAWLLWGKTIGGTIFDVRVVSPEGGAMALKSASMRWLGVLLSIALGGIGFLLALLPSRRSLPDRLSDTHCVSAG